jgi:DNA-binding NtrC family response regulator
MRAATPDQRQHKFAHSVPAKVLLVDDDHLGLHALTGTLQHGLGRHFTLTTCETGLHALECATATRYDTIISDLRMPGMTGLDLLESVRKVQPNTPFVLMSGCADRAMITQALDAGLSDFIAKPIDRVVFLFTIRQTLYLSRLLALVQEQDSRLRRSRDGYWRAFKRLEHCHQPVMSVFRTRMRRHLARLDAFLAKATEIHLRTTHDLTLVRETLRGLAYSRLSDE